MKYKISVIIPTYNRLSLLEDCLESAFLQSSENISLDVILVDDGSTDGTGNRYSRDPRLNYIFKANGGVSSARNIGIRSSKAEFIAFLDSDDRWLPGKLEKQINCLENGDFDAVVTDVWRTDNDGRILNRSWRRKVIRRDGDILQYVVRGASLIPPTLLCRNRVFEEIGCFNETLRTAEDVEFFLRMASRCRIGLVEEPLVYCNRRRTDSISRGLQSYEDHYEVMRKFLTQEVHGIPKRERNEILSKILYDSAKDLTYSKNYSLSKKKIIESIKLNIKFRYVFQMIKNELKGISSGIYFFFYLAVTY